MSCFCWRAADVVCHVYHLNKGHFKIDVTYYTYPSWFLSRRSWKRTLVLKSVFKIFRKKLCVAYVFFFKKLHWEEKDININGHNLTDLRFADDIILSDNLNDIKQMLQELQKVCSKTAFCLFASLSKLCIVKKLYPKQINKHTKPTKLIFKMMSKQIKL